MGANDKSDATYHGGEYTPDTEIVRAVYAYYNQAHQAHLARPRNEDFDRWLETVRAEAKAEALEELADTYGALPNFQAVLLTRAARTRDRANQYKENQS